MVSKARRGTPVPNEDETPARPVGCGRWQDRGTDSLFEQDYIVRQIRQFGVFLAHLLNKESPFLEDGQLVASSEAGQLLLQLRALVRQKRINEAENLLFDCLRADDRSYLEAALDFYSGLNELPDEVLQACDFSREEIQQGLTDTARLFGLCIPWAELDG